MDGSAEQHMPSGIKGALPEAIAGRYGKTRVRGGATILAHDVLGLDRFVFRFTYGWAFGSDVEDPYSFGREYFAYPGWSTDVGLYFRSYGGQDPYNINFENALFRTELDSLNKDHLHG